ncbi:autophagy protein 13 [Dinochytrium kinnereticum]|nr:autophagy protein 13 [Dinochytrium kinnereticum]
MYSHQGAKITSPKPTDSGSMGPGGGGGGGAGGPGPNIGDRIMPPFFSNSKDAASSVLSVASSAGSVVTTSGGSGKTKDESIVQNFCSKAAQIIVQSRWTHPNSQQLPHQHPSANSSASASPSHSPAIPSSPPVGSPLVSRRLSAGGFRPGSPAPGGHLGSPLALGLAGHGRNLHVKTNKWFNLETPDIEPLRTEMKQWRSMTSSASPPPPLIIDLYLDLSELAPNQILILKDEVTQRRKRIAPELLQVHDMATGALMKRKRVLLETWQLSMAHPIPVPAPEVPVMYKKMVMFFRSLYSFTRLLPAYRLFRKLRKSKGGPLKIGYRLSTGRVISPDEAGLDQLHLTSDMRRWVSEYRFENVDTMLGTFNLHVAYRLECEFTVDNPEAVLSSRFADMDNNYFGPRSLDIPAQRGEPSRLSGRQPSSINQHHAASSLPARQSYAASSSSQGSAGASSGPVVISGTSPNALSSKGAVNIPSGSLPVHLRAGQAGGRTSIISTSPSPDVYRYRIGSATSVGQDLPTGSGASSSRMHVLPRRDGDTSGSLKRVSSGQSIPGLSVHYASPFLQSPGSNPGNLASRDPSGSLFDPSEPPPFSALNSDQILGGALVEGEEIEKTIAAKKKSFRLSSDALFGLDIGSPPFEHVRALDSQKSKLQGGRSSSSLANSGNSSHSGGSNVEGMTRRPSFTFPQASPSTTVLHPSQLAAVSTRGGGSSGAQTIILGPTPSGVTPPIGPFLFTPSSSHLFLSHNLLSSGNRLSPPPLVTLVSASSANESRTDQDSRSAGDNVAELGDFLRAMDTKRRSLQARVGIGASDGSPRSQDGFGSRSSAGSDASLLRKSSRSRIALARFQQLKDMNASFSDSLHAAINKEEKETAPIAQTTQRPVLELLDAEKEVGLTHAGTRVGLSNETIEQRYFGKHLSSLSRNHALAITAPSLSTVMSESGEEGNASASGPGANSGSGTGGSSIGASTGSSDNLHPLPQPRAADISSTLIPVVQGMSIELPSAVPSATLVAPLQGGRVRSRSGGVMSGMGYEALLGENRPGIDGTGVGGGLRSGNSGLTGLEREWARKPPSAPFSSTRAKLSVGGGMFAPGPGSSPSATQANVIVATEPARVSSGFFPTQKTSSSTEGEPASPTGSSLKSTAVSLGSTPTSSQIYSFSPNQATTSSLQGRGMGGAGRIGILGPSASPSSFAANSVRSASGERVAYSSSSSTAAILALPAVSSLYPRPAFTFSTGSQRPFSAATDPARRSSLPPSNSQTLLTFDASLSPLSSESPAYQGKAAPDAHLRGPSMPSNAMPLTTLASKATPDGVVPSASRSGPVAAVSAPPIGAAAGVGIRGQTDDGEPFPMDIRGGGKGRRRRGKLMEDDGYGNPEFEDDDEEDEEEDEDDFEDRDKTAFGLGLGGSRSMGGSDSFETRQQQPTRLDLVRSGVGFGVSLGNGGGSGGDFGATPGPVVNALGVRMGGEDGADIFDMSVQKKIYVRAKHKALEKNTSLITLLSNMTAETKTSCCDCCTDCACASSGNACSCNANRAAASGTCSCAGGCSCANSATGGCGCSNAKTPAVAAHTCSCRDGCACGPSECKC